LEEKNVEDKKAVQEQMPVIIAPFHTTPKTPEQAAEGYSTVTMEFPNPVHLTIATNDTVFYPKGVHEVPEHLADHWYLEAHDARRYYKPVAAPKAVVQPQTSQQQQNRQQNNQQNGQKRNGGK
jgi:hypothetical protein